MTGSTKSEESRVTETIPLPKSGKAARGRRAKEGYMWTVKTELPRERK